MQLFCRVLVTAAVLITALPDARADEVTKTAKIEQIFHLANLDKVLQQTLETSATQVKSGFFQQLMGLHLTQEEEKSMDVVQDKLQKILTDGLSWPTLKPAYVKLYSDMFSEEEIDGMLAFYQSPAGKAMLEKTPKLMVEANAVVQQRMIVMRPQFEALLKEVDGLKSK